MLFKGVFAEGSVSALLDLSLPRFLAKAINSEVMKLVPEPEQGGGLVTREGRGAPSRVGRNEK